MVNSQYIQLLQSVSGDPDLLWMVLFPIISHDYVYVIYRNIELPISDLLYCVDPQHQHRNHEEYEMSQRPWKLGHLSKMCMERPEDQNHGRRHGKL